MIEVEKQGSLPTPLEIWGGIECTVNRVGERFYDQLVWNGHHSRPEDLTRFAKLGIRAIRYPVLWERTAPDGPQSASWHWSDDQLYLLRLLNVQPIVGLLHHGSGPYYTNLLDPAFPQKLAEYARRVAARYPWVTTYTPINEPLTTARFSGLYGHWYPHLKDPQSFVRMLINQIRGTQQAMQAIREINPAAQLVQTEDIGKVYSTENLEYQARHENERRWLTFDLLTGRVDQQHPLFHYLTWLGITAQELEEIQRDATPPDILGINYYVTSERYLDDRIDLFPASMHGGNELHTYVDLEAVRVCTDQSAGRAGILQEAWERYQRPLALTEVHLRGHREQQLRWWVEAWRTAHASRQRGVDIRAITAWALLGNFNWDNLVTQDNEFYESGAFDIRSSHPRPTLLARAIESVAKKGSFDHPALDAPGWWQSEQRLFHPVECHNSLASDTSALSWHRPNGAPRPVLITGANGTLGRAFQRICESRNIPFLAFSHGQLDIASERNVAQVLTEARPWAVINTAGYVRVDEAERNSEACRLANAIGPAVLAQLCASQGTALLSFSSDLVFSGAQSSPYLESNIPDPLNMYGVSKAEGEARILEANPQGLIIRSGAFFSPWDSVNFLMQVSQSVSARQEFIAANDVLISPTYVPELVHACLDLLIDGERGIWHLTNQGEVSWFDFANQFIRTAGLSDTYLRSAPLEHLPLVAKRPRYSVLSSERGLLLSDLQDAIYRFVQAAERGTAATPANIHQLQEIFQW